MILRGGEIRSAEQNTDSGQVVLGRDAEGDVLDAWLDVLGGSFWPVAGVAGLGIAAIGLTFTGLNSLWGARGLGVGAVLMVLVNSFSGMTSAPEMLPGGWGVFGQLLPPGAYGSAMRSVAFFEGAGSGTPLLILTCWVMLGLVLVGVAALRQPVGSQEDAVVVDEREPAYA